MSKKQDTGIEEAPGLGDIKVLFPPTSALDAVPMAANVSMKLLVFGQTRRKTGSLKRMLSLRSGMCQ